ncbi:TRAP transporter small permease [Rhizobium puerariae]|uniref:TRAP transporter small permease protein n=1 Tax=Rhizobium puerariae TaxID=1585791 RepID=A0ABV6ALE5_9HYPH
MQHSSESVSPTAERGIRGIAIAVGDGISLFCTQLSGLALIAIVLICTFNVIGRYVFLHAFSWAEEAMVYCMIFVIFFASAAVTWRGQHLNLDMALRKFPKGMQRLIVYVGTLASVGLLVLLAATSWNVVAKLYRFGQLSEALGIPMWIPQSFVPIGLLLVALMMLLRLVAHDPLPKAHDFAAEDQEL